MVARILASLQVFRDFAGLSDSPPMTTAKHSLWWGLLLCSALPDEGQVLHVHKSIRLGVAGHQNGQTLGCSLPDLLARPYVHVTALSLAAKRPQGPSLVSKVRTR